MTRSELLCVHDRPLVRFYRFRAYQVCLGAWVPPLLARKREEGTPVSRHPHPLPRTLNDPLYRENLLGDGMLNRDGDLWKTVCLPFV